MSPHKYTYDDWIAGKLENPDALKLFVEKLIGKEDYQKIVLEQSAAYVKGLQNAFETLKHEFKSSYKDSLLKIKYLDIQLNLCLESLNGLESKFEGIAQKAAYTSTDGRYLLTKQQVDEFNTSQINDSNMQTISFNFLIGYYGDMPAFYYILAANFYNWMLWFKEQESISPTEPVLIFSESDTYAASLRDVENATRQRKEQVRYTWPNLFKDPKQADKILNLIAEHLSSTGQWLTEPKGRHLVALCTELESKGYFKSDNALTNPVKAAAFMNQFEVQLTDKNFQPQRKNDAEGYREHFQHIPNYKAIP